MIRVEDASIGTVWVTCLLAVGLYFIRSRLLSDQFAGFPSVNSRKPWEVLNVFAHRRFQQNGPEYLKAGFAKSPVFGVVTDLGPKLVVSGAFIEDFKDEKLLDHYRAMVEDFMAEVPGFESMFLGNLHNTVLRDVISVITRELDQFTLPLSDEVSTALGDTWSDSPDWTEVTLLPSMLGLIARVSSLIFVGEPLCRDPAWLETVVNFTIVRHQAILALHMCPAVLRPVLHWFLPPCQKLRREIKTARSLINSALEELRKNPPTDRFSSLAWVDAFASGKKYDATMVQLRLANASIHSSADLLAKVLINLCEQPGLIQDLRDEVISVLEENGWRASTLNQLKLLDSVLKESQRLHPITTGTFSRFTRQNIKLTNGTEIPTGTPVMVTNDVAGDAAIYPDPEVFDGYRYLRMREGADKARAPFTTTGQNHLGFGYGKYACPGRFFAATEIKIALCHMLLKYEWRLVKDSPHDMLTSGFASFRDPRARIEVRSRAPDPQEVNLLHFISIPHPFKDKTAAAMDGWSDLSSAPPQYREVAGIADWALLAQGLGWSINYLAMIYHSYKDRTYGMAILPLCCNFAWEFVYSVIYPSHNSAERAVLTTWMILNLFVMYTAIKFAPNEWQHAPLVRQCLPWIFPVAIAAFTAGHLALAATVGVSKAANWGAFLCFELLTSGAVCQLMSRGSSRGASYTIWLSRFLGSYIGGIFLHVRETHWPQEFGWISHPFVTWHGLMCFSLDIAYVTFLWRIRRQEHRSQRKKAL
ncbi:Cytochrome P450 monooxygenase pyr9 [Aspergillus fumigatus]|nr:Cytochrome P450 monooxygenase pyr9 [Aspergillus fumigatus]KAH1400770.1 Cytochrome P450 monooxygenase pyr9 [Aspergillus fumigatus]KAH1522289.1 Cytochrome P450 monooxygenase pyr9 [Aspergillus fumigatus]KAH1620355.1 Cytochrome P450 monooxygenase pyr9 [Aspergillus fumigatus]KAH1798960.1 Cytochrome P450 monooxygenase pyr9 [Aspergillus fumigatus]